MQLKLSDNFLNDNKSKNKRSNEGNNYKYQNDEADDVYNYIIDGYRFKGFKSDMSWTGSYYGKYFSCNNMTLLDAFNKFDDEYDNITVKLFRERFGKIIKEGGLL